MRQNVVVVSVMAVLGTTNVSVLGAMDSGVFGVQATSAPISRDTRDLIDFGGVASVLFEDAPQVCRCVVVGDGREISSVADPFVVYVVHPPLPPLHIFQQLVVAVLYLAKENPDEKAVVYLTLLGSAASVLTGLFLRLVLCCVVGVDGTDGDRGPEGEEAGTELDSVNPTFAAE